METTAEYVCGGSEGRWLMVVPVERRGEGGGELDTTAECIDGSKGRWLVLVPLEPLRRLRAVLVPLERLPQTAPPPGGEPEPGKDHQWPVA